MNPPTTSSPATTSPAGPGPTGQLPETGSPTTLPVIVTAVVTLLAGLALTQVRRAGASRGGRHLAD